MFGTQTHQVRAREGVSVASVLRLEPGASCLRRDILAAQVERWLSGEQVEPGLLLEVEGDAKFSRFVTIRVSRAGTALSERRFEPGPAGCDDLHAAVAIAVALSCKAAAHGGTAQSSQAPAAPRERSSLRVALSALGGAGVLPGLEWGGSLGLTHIVSRSWSLRAVALALHAPARPLTSEGELVTSLVAGRLQLCAATARSAPLQLGACAGPEAGVVWASGQGYARALRALGPRWGLGAELETRLRLGEGWFAALGVGVSLPASRTRFAARDAQGALVAVERLPVLGLLTSLGLSFEF